MQCTLRCDCNGHYRSCIVRRGRLGAEGIFGERIVAEKMLQCRAREKEDMNGPKPLPQPELNAAYYRQRAQESRDAANRASDPRIRQQLLDIAEGYDRLAELDEAWERDHPNRQR